MKIIIGLGNPGVKYKHTRHNVGEEFVHGWARQSEHRASTGVVVAFPKSFMNTSGQAVKKLITFYKTSPQDLLIVHDDIDLALGKIRQVFDSRSGGHNGVESIIESLGTSEFHRLKIGINPADASLAKMRRTDAAQFVLGKFGPQEKQALKEIFPQVVREIVKFIED